MSELKFADTKWDARAWTREQKIQWQKKAFECGYTLGSEQTPACLYSKFFFLSDNETVTQYRGDLDYFTSCGKTLMYLEDMFREEENTQQTLSENSVGIVPSIFAHPRWVTSLTFLEREVRGLTEGKDYKVIDVVYKGGELHQYILCNDEGVVGTYHISHFHKVTPEECTYLPSVEPEEEEEEVDGFDNLVYCQPDIPRRDYWYIKLNSLSQEQINCIYESFATDRRWSFGGTEDILMYQVGNYDVWTNTFERCILERMHEVSFNDIFKEVC